MLGQNLPRSAEQYARSQRKEIEAATAAIRRLWRRVTPDLDASYAAVAVQLGAVVTTAQGRLATEALDYVPAVLAETGQSATVFAQAVAAPLIGVAGDGRPVEGLLRHGVVRTKVAIGEGASATTALADSGRWLSRAAQATLSDTGRQGEALAMGVRPVTHYVRMLNPPSCSRCAILAGVAYRMAEAFARHPGCDCRHIPATESDAQDLTVDPRAYFDSLTEAEQDATFTIAGAKAIRDGADIRQVVNVRRGMTTSQHGRAKRTAALGGQNFTTESGRRLYGVRDTTRGRPYVRLMPESISEIAAGDRTKRLALLRQHGYLA